MHHNDTPIDWGASTYYSDGTVVRPASSTPAEVVILQPHRRAPLQVRRRDVYLGYRPYLIHTRRIDIHGSMIRFTAEYQDANPYYTHHPRRGVVTSFSPRSRIRALHALAAINPARHGSPFFVTLTWHRVAPEEWQRPVTVLDRWLVRVRRKFPTVAWIWRLDFQQRGTPHFHVILFPGSTMIDDDRKALCKWCADEWHRLADPKSPAHKSYGARVESPRSIRQAMKYLAKYAAKQSLTERTDIQGRRWGRSRNLCVEPIVSLNVDPSLWYQLRRFCRRWLRSTARLSHFARTYGRGNHTVALFCPVNIVIRWLTEAIPRGVRSWSSDAWSPILDVCDHIDAYSPDTCWYHDAPSLPAITAVDETA